MQLRKLNAADAPQFREFRRFSLQNEPDAFGESVDEWDRSSLEDIAARLTVNPAENFVIGAFDGERLAGTIGFHRMTREKLRHKGTVWGVFVHPEYRGRGLAGRMLAAVLEEAGKLAGVRTVLLTVAATNEAARRLYLSAGFRSIGVEPGALRTAAGYIDQEQMYCDLASRG